MATLRASTSALLGTITTSADTVTKTITTVAVGVDMLSVWANNEAAKQKANLKYEPAIIEKEAKQKAVLRIADLNMEAAQYANRSAAHATAMSQAEIELENLMK